MKTVDEIRKQIDSIDDKIAELYVERMSAVKDIANAKQGEKKAVNDPNREDKIIYRLTENAPEELKIYIKEVYKAVFHTSKSYQTSLLSASSVTKDKINEILEDGLKPFPVQAAVACQGVLGAYSGSVAKKVFSISDVTYFKNFDGVFSAVENGLCEFGVLPIENSTAGSVSEVYDLMKKHDFYIVRSVRAKIEHALVSVNGSKIEDIKKVISHPQALKQCENYLKNLKVEVESVENTAIAAKMVMEAGDKSVAALCSCDCAEIYGLKILEKNVQDSGSNYTRFICIAKNLQIYKNADRISIMTSISHKPGSLNGIIGKFSALGLNLLKIESRPIPNSEFEFMFYFDFEGDLSDVKVQNLIAELENGSDKFVFLGAYKELI